MKQLEFIKSTIRERWACGCHFIKIRMSSLYGVFRGKTVDQSRQLTLNFS